MTYQEKEVAKASLIYYLLKKGIEAEVNSRLASGITQSMLKELSETLTLAVEVMDEAEYEYEQQVERMERSKK